MNTSFINIKNLFCIAQPELDRRCGKEMSEIQTIQDAFLTISGDKIVDFGSMLHYHNNGEKTIDIKGKSILPTWCDAHTHIVFAAPREQEFIMKIQGKTYEEIAAAGGGILHSAHKLADTSEDDLFAAAYQRLHRLITLGTGAIEIKSGYGLSTEAELKMLRVIKRLKAAFDIPVKATFLGAHAFPLEFKENKSGYVQKIIEEMLPKIHDEQLADYIDVFCEKGFFSVSDTDKILKAGAQYGLKAKIHANQLAISGGVQVGVANDALSVDHLEEIDEEAISSLQSQKTIATLLPSCSFFLGIPFAPARKLIDAGLSFALASDFNPGSTPSGNMNFVVSLACIKMKLLPEEAINAATINGAYAMDLSATHGTITKGKKASFIITKEIPSLAYIPYNFGDHCIEEVWINGALYGSTN